MSLTAYQISIPVMIRGLAVLDDYLGHAQARGPRAEHGEDLRRALYRLDHDTLSAMPNNIQDMP